MDNNEWDFEDNFEIDEEIEAAADAMEEWIKKKFDNKEQFSIVNPHRKDAVMYTYKLMCYLTRGTSSEVSYEMHKPTADLGRVSIVGKNITFSKPELFTEATKIASSFNAYQKEDGTAQIDFGFSGLTTSVE